MLAEVEDEGVLSIVPESQEDLRELKWFLKEFATHGNKMINVVTDLNKAREYLRKHYQQRNAFYSTFTESENEYNPRRRSERYQQEYSPYYDRQRENEEGVFPKDKEYAERYYSDNPRPRSPMRGGESGRNN